MLRILKVRHSKIDADLHDMTGLGRPVDMRYRSNRMAAAGTVTALVLAAAITWLADGRPDLLRALSAGGGVFLAWAIARELDPDRTQTATVAMAIGGALAFVGPAALLVSGVLLLAVRILAGTVGSELKPADLLVVVGAAVYSGTQAVAWPVATLLLYAVIRQKPRFYPVAAAAMVVGFVIAVLVSGAAADLGRPEGAAGIVLVVGVLTGAAAFPVGQIASPTDHGSRMIQAADIGKARIGALATILVGSLLAPSAGSVLLSPSVAAVAAVGLMTLLSIWQRHPQTTSVVDEIPSDREQVAA